MSSSIQSMRVTSRRILEQMLLLGAMGLIGSFFSSALAAGFTTNFQPDATVWTTQNTGYCTYGTCTSHIGNTDPTPMGLTVVNIGGVNYFHTLVGDPATGFAIESYTRAAGLNTGNTIGNSGGAFSPDGGGNERSVIGATVATDNTFLQNSLNMSNPLAVDNQGGFNNYQVSGTGSMNPNFTVFRMVLTDPTPGGGMSMEVYKPFLDKKPRISQTIEDGGMSSVFVADERALSYSDSSTPAPVINNLVINDPGLPSAGAADFEMALAQIPDVTAGRFTYTPGTGWGPNATNPTQDPTLGWDQANSSFGQGTYNYVGGQGFDPLTFDWSTVFNYGDNAISCGSPSTSSGNVSRETVGIYNGLDALGNPVGGSCYNKP